MKQLREEYVQRIAKWAMDKLWFVDESGAYLGMTRRYGWAHTDARVHGSVPTNYGTPWTMVAMIGVKGVHAPCLLEGAMNADAFATYISEVACPVLQPGDIVIMDNLSAHKRADIAAAIQARGARLEFLPPYSPDFNPIELCWSKVKQALRSARAATPDPLLKALARALRSVSISDITHSMRHSGYAFT